MKISAHELAALMVAISFAAGLNVYATIATLGLLARYGIVPIPDQLGMLQNWVIIGASSVLFVIEFFADKIPAIDLIWNVLHTFIRVPIAALLAYAASSQLSTDKQLLAATLGGVIALAAHGGKTAIRAVATPSPEPISNISLSFGSDALAIFLTWFAAHHPYAAAAIVVVLLVMTAFIITWLIRVLKNVFGAICMNLSRAFKYGAQILASK